MKNIIEEVGPIVELGEVTKIDTDAPNQINLTTSNVTSRSVTVTANAQDHEPTETSGCSQIDTYCFRIKGEDKWHSLGEDKTDNEEKGQKDNSYTFDNLSDGTAYEFEVQVTDHAGNSAIGATDENNKAILKYIQINYQT